MKLKLQITTCLIALGTVVAAAPTEPMQHEWKFKVKFVNEAGEAIAGVQTRLYYLSTNKVEGITNPNGVFATSHMDASDALTLEASGVGYYSFRTHYHLSRQFSPEKWTFDQTVVLKTIGKPIPMYARDARIEIPPGTNSFGFDLIEYDWVSPYGKGKQADFIFTPSRRWISHDNFDSSVRIAVSNKGDGFVPVQIPLNQGNKLRLPAIAPWDGYVPEISKRLSHTFTDGWIDDERNGNKAQNYYFRVRTLLDNKNEIKSALYGKLYGDFGLDPINSKTIKIFFTYYLNPTPNSRNVEFDPKRNLFEHTSTLEKITDP